LLHPTHAAPRFLCISLRYILSTKTALQHVRLSKALGVWELNIYKMFGLSALLIAFCSHSYGNVCEVGLPIDSIEKAWCAADYTLQIQSCLSLYEYHRETKDLEDRWVLHSWDEGKNGETTCRPIIISVCKNSGKLLYENSKEQCSS
jgi:hypothetical protein